jgi:antitoxin PrlF
MAYTGRATRSGNSRAFAFESSLFRSHPEFSDGRVVADYIGPGTLLVRMVEDPADSAEDDPVLEAFLAFIDRDMREHPERIRPLSPDLLARVDELVGHIDVDMDEDLGDYVSLP